VIATYDVETEASAWYGPEVSFGLMFPFIQPGESRRLHHRWKDKVYEDRVGLIGQSVVIIFPCKDEDHIQRGKDINQLTAIASGIFRIDGFHRTVRRVLSMEDPMPPKVSVFDVMLLVISTRQLGTLHSFITNTLKPQRKSIMNTDRNAFCVSGKPCTHHLVLVL
jgi:hypothetical protein